MRALSYEVVSVEFDNELHARWSVFFDEAGVPWSYQPAIFHEAGGTEFTPAFWLPVQRCWFHPVTPRSGEPPWWHIFAHAVTGRACHQDDEQCAPRPDDALATEVQDLSERWSGDAFLHVGLVPRAGLGSSHDIWQPSDMYYSAEEMALAWSPGLEPVYDSGYKFTMCPRCDCFGATFLGRAERLPCSCLPDEKTYNDQDPRLMAAYEAAWLVDIDGLDPWTYPQRAGGPEHDDRTVTVKTLSEAPPPGDGAVAAEASEDTAQGETAAQTPLGCPGCACPKCQGAATGQDGHCANCRRAARLDLRRAKSHLNAIATTLVREHGMDYRQVHPIINKAMGVRSRDHATLEDLAAGLNIARKWIDGTTPFPQPRTEPLTAVEQLKRDLHRTVGQASLAVGVSIAVVNARLNTATGATSRTAATEAQLQAGLQLALQWRDDPAAFPPAVVAIPVPHPSAEVAPTAKAGAGARPASVSQPVGVGRTVQLSFRDMEPRYRPTRGSSSIKPEKVAPWAPVPTWSSDPTLADAFMRLWVRWAHGVPVSWTRTECAVLVQVVLDGTDIEPLRRGPVRQWSNMPRPSSQEWTGAQVVGYAMDSIEHGFACNLGHQACVQMLATAGRACWGLGLTAEAEISRRMFDLIRDASERRLRSPERLALAAATDFPWPCADYRVEGQSRRRRTT